jgi:hypothetical protein
MNAGRRTRRLAVRVPTPALSRPAEGLPVAPGADPGSRRRASQARLVRPWTHRRCLFRADRREAESSARQGSPAQVNLSRAAQQIGRALPQIGRPVQQVGRAALWVTRTALGGPPSDRARVPLAPRAGLPMARAPRRARRAESLAHGLPGGPGQLAHLRASRPVRPRVCGREAPGGRAAPEGGPLMACRREERQWTPCPEP